MRKVIGWLAALGFGRGGGGAPPQTDWADMGTAFGLDASLMDEDGEASEPPREPPPLPSPG